MAVAGGGAEAGHARSSPAVAGTVQPTTVRAGRGADFGAARAPPPRPRADPPPPPSSSACGGRDGTDLAPGEGCHESCSDGHDERCGDATDGIATAMDTTPTAEAIARGASDLLVVTRRFC